MYILLIGDTHIPDRAQWIPEKLLQIIENGKPWDIVVFTGDLTSREVLEWINSLGRETYVVKGNMDYLPLPRTQVFNVENYSIGIYHGDGIYPRGDTKGLTRIASKLNVDILFTGHTHSPFIKKGSIGSKLLINPGSLTGVWGGGGGSMKPSMMVVELSGNGLDITQYEIMNDTLAKRTIRAYRDGEWVIK